VSPHTVQPLTERTFLPENTLRLLTEACLRAGLDPGGARLLRHQTNAVYQLASEPVVVKISRPGADRAHIERTLALVQ
jgi:Ser/Thr protein kinase RdoA (MazF antagonist)